MFFIYLSLSLLTHFKSPNSSYTPPILPAIPVRNVGYATKGIRISALAVYEPHSKIFYIGSGNGGVLKTIDGGKTVKFVFDRQGSANIGAIAISQKNSDLVWIGTGECWQRNSVGDGDGIYKSTDGGKTWQHMGLKKCRSFGKIAIDPTNDNIVFAAGMGSAWGYGPDRGIYKTKDGGKTWRKVLYNDEKSAATYIIIDPKNPKKMLAALWDHIHRPYGWFESGLGSAIYKSSDGGETWHKVSKGLPTTNFGRTALAYFRQDPNYVIAAIEAAPPATGIYKSIDGGETWTEMPAIHYGSHKGEGYIGEINKNPADYWYRPYYNQEININPLDKNKIYHGNPGHRSHDGGKTWVGWTSDSHGMWIDPKDGQHYIQIDDGGVNQGWDLDNVWKMYDHKIPLDTIEVPLPPLDQVYSVGCDTRKLYRIFADMQDWGPVACAPSQSPYTIGVTEADTQLLQGGGEGGGGYPDPNDWSIVYCTGAGLTLEREDIRTGTSQNLLRGKFQNPGYATDSNYPVYQKMNPKTRAGWTPPFHISPWDSRTIYFGLNYLIRSRDRGDNWEVISPDLTHDNPDWQKPDGVVYRNNENPTCRIYQTIQTISESPLKRDMIWVGTDDGYVQLTKDGGKDWENVTKNIPGLPEYAWCSRIEASRFSEGRAYATFLNHKNNDHNTYIYVTEDYGKSWTKIVGNMDSLQPCYVIREGLKNPNLLYVGTEFALWVSLDRGKSWDHYQDFVIQNNGKAESGYFPTVRVSDLVIQPRELDLVIGAHGRGVWVMEARALEEMTPENRDKDVYFCTPGNVYLFPTLRRLYSEHKFETPNTQPGTLFSYYLKQDTPGEAKIQITDASGLNVIASDVKGPAKSGLNAIRWMNFGKIKKPGDYRVILTVNDKKYYQTLHVEDATDEVMGAAYQTKGLKKLSDIAQQQEPD